VKIVLWFLFGLDFLFQKPVYLWKVSSVTLSFKMSFLVLLIRFLRCCKFQVVSGDRRVETAPDLSLSEHVKPVLAKL